MKKLTLVLAALASVSAFADDAYTNGYTRADGRTVSGYHHTTSDDSVNNNYGTVGNTNPYSGNDGTRARRDDQSAGNYNYGNGETTGRHRSHKGY